MSPDLVIAVPTSDRVDRATRSSSSFESALTRTPPPWTMASISSSSADRGLTLNLKVVCETKQLFLGQRVEILSRQRDLSRGPPRTCLRGLAHFVSLLGSSAFSASVPSSPCGGRTFPRPLGQTIGLPASLSGNVLCCLRCLIRQVSGLLQRLVRPVYCFAGPQLGLLGPLLLLPGTSRGLCLGLLDCVRGLSLRRKAGLLYALSRFAFRVLADLLHELIRLPCCALSIVRAVVGLLGQR